MTTPSRLAVVLAGIVAGSAAMAPAGAQTPPPPGAVLPGPLDPARLPSRPGPAGTSPLPGMPPRDTSAGRTPETGSAVIRGRVTALDTGLPLRRVQVSLFGGSLARTSTTDADGAFTFDELPAGRYQLRASKPRYVDTSLGARRPGGAGRPIDLADGQTLESVTLALPAAGVITGRVLDDAGEVVTGAAVTAMRYRTFNGERQLVPVGRPRTSDDTGTFRLFGLAPGSYYLSARAEEFPRFSSEVVTRDESGFAPTFYPGTPVAAEAQPIEVVAGTEILADVQLVTARLTTVTGIVVSPSGAPATGGHIMVSGGSAQGGRFMSGGFGGPIKADGTFVLAGLPPGEYTIGARASFRVASMYEPFPADDQPRIASTIVVATGEPISGVRLVVQDPVRIPVNVVFDDASIPKPERVMVSAGAEGGIGGGTATMRDGRLTLDVVPGTYRLSVGAMGPTAAQPWLVKRIVYRGRDVEEDAVELTAEPGGRIDVLFTTRASSVTGAVTDDNGKPVTDYTLILVPEDAELLRRAAHRRLRMTRPDAQGRFRLEHLPPGRYLATALSDAPLEDVYEPDFLDGLRRTGTPVTVAEGGSANVALKLTPLP